MIGRIMRTYNKYSFTVSSGIAKSKNLGSSNIVRVEKKTRMMLIPQIKYVKVY